MTAHPTGAWVAQQARNLVLALGDALLTRRFLIRDRDTKFAGVFDEVFRTEGFRVIRTPVRAPRANAHAERWVGTLRRECLDWTLVLGCRYLEAVLREYVAHYNAHRPHRALDLRPPGVESVPAQPGPSPSLRQVRRRDRLGGLIHEYALAA